MAQNVFLYGRWVGKNLRHTPLCLLSGAIRRWNRTNPSGGPRLTGRCGCSGWSKCAKECVVPAPFPRVLSHRLSHPRSCACSIISTILYYNSRAAINIDLVCEIVFRVAVFVLLDEFVLLIFLALISYDSSIIRVSPRLLLPLIVNPFLSRSDVKFIQYNAFKNK
jgi:hypothetical protein